MCADKYHARMTELMEDETRYRQYQRQMNVLMKRPAYKLDLKQMKEVSLYVAYMKTKGWEPDPLNGQWLFVGQ